MTAPTRRRREVTRRADGSAYRIPRPPRPDILYYPAADLTTVLVRRTHLQETARPLAIECWQHLLDHGLVEDELGTDFARCMRIGWWTTSPGPARPRHRDQAQDRRERVVTACLDTTPNASPGIEYRP